MMLGVLVFIGKVPVQAGCDMDMIGFPAERLNSVRCRRKRRIILHAGTVLFGIDKVDRIGIIVIRVDVAFFPCDICVDNSAGCDVDRAGARRTAVGADGGSVDVVIIYDIGIGFVDMLILCAGRLDIAAVEIDRAAERVAADRGGAVYGNSLSFVKQTVSAFGVDNAAVDGDIYGISGRAAALADTRGSLRRRR